MRFVAAFALVVAVISGAGCGSSSSSKGHTTGAPQSCKAAGIGVGGKEGECRDNNGHLVVVVNKGSTLRLGELDVRYLGNAKMDRLLGAKSNLGTFVVLTLAVTNNLKVPMAFSPQQALLGVGDMNYTHDTAAEKRLGNSFELNNAAIPPGGTKTGTLIYDVRAPHAAEFDRSGNITILQFSDAGAKSIKKLKKPFGVIRTYQ